MTQHFIPALPNGRLNNTMRVYRQHSEENIVMRGKVNNDSFYSFALAGGPKKPNMSSVYNGQIYRKSFPNERVY